MTRNQFHQMHIVSAFPLGKFFEKNDLPSFTDPTQDIPVSQIQLLPNGEPLNVKKKGLQYSNIPIDKMTALDKRLNDKFDILGDLQTLENKTTKTIKQFKKNEK